MKNEMIRKRIRDAGLKHWQVAEAVGVDPGTLCIWLRKELSGDRLRRVQTAIDKLTEARTQGGKDE